MANDMGQLNSGQTTPCNTSQSPDKLLHQKDSPKRSDNELTCKHTYNASDRQQSTRLPQRQTHRRPSSGPQISEQNLKAGTESAKTTKLTIHDDLICNQTPPQQIHRQEIEVSTKETRHQNHCSLTMD
ncbi:hypothetical protein CHS0354_028153, partial [Potamilus streckersoni]